MLPLYFPLSLPPHLSHYLSLPITPPSSYSQSLNVNIYNPGANIYLAMSTYLYLYISLKSLQTLEPVSVLFFLVVGFFVI